jgi:exopolysaccharide biosynthesis polyprenyl glycosylphosphotransferase
MKAFARRPPDGPWPLTRLSPRLLQCGILGVLLLVTAGLLDHRIRPESASVEVIRAAAVLLVLPFAFSVTAFARRMFPERMLIVGTGSLAKKLVEEIAVRRHGPDLIVGIADDVTDGVEAPLRELVAGPLARLGTIIQELRPDRIVVAMADRRGRLPVGELLEARVRGVAVEDAVDLYERLTGKLAIESLTPSHIISSKDFRKSHFDLAFGRVASVIASAIALVVLTPLLALIALAIKFDSSGPVLFVQDRVGRGGRKFRLIKFRTMRPAATVTSEWAGDNGDRITALGKWLRKFRLDELPQLINVLRGEMNLVGPRPHPVSNFELFLKNIPYYSLRAIIRPGLTGWAQVRQGYANSLEEETEKMRYDLYYIKHMSAWLDLRILFSTIGTVLVGRESNAVAVARRAAPVAAGDIRFVTVPVPESVLRPVPADRMAAVRLRPAPEIQPMPPAPSSQLTA